MRKHASWGRMISIIALLITYVDSLIFIVGHVSVSSEEGKVNITILGHQAGYAVPSTCTLTHFHISTSMYLVIFVLEYIYLMVMCTSNHGKTLAIILNINNKIFIYISLRHYFRYFLKYLSHTHTRAHTHTCTRAHTHTHIQIHTHTDVYLVMNFLNSAFLF